MKEEEIRKILMDLQKGNIGVKEAMDQLRHLPFIDLGDVKIDMHRGIRKGIPEAIFAPGKTKEQIIKIVREMIGKDVLFITKASDEIYEALKEFDAHYYKQCKLIVIGRKRNVINRGYIAVATAGTGDIPIAEEAAITAETLGNEVRRVYDIGVAGIHRLLEFKELLAKANVIIATAGMDGVLPGIISSLFPPPVIALPTSIGYGTGLNGLAAMLTMLNSCSPGMAVVNIDNGFGAGIFAHLVNSLRRKNEDSIH
ncbi:MAG: nickel pincer cofactor biosynthesis protein LarB [Thermoplasmata archaeon]|nr:MAG: nickel pincer cofactor biosynthesis protein LarB [Thermoplasmata archaeon]